MTGPETAGGGQCQAPAGLPGKLMAAVRPEFRGGVLAFGLAGPVFGGDACRVPRCGRTARSAGMCYARCQRRDKAGRPGPAAFAAPGEAAGPWSGHAPLAGCTVPGCGFGAAQRRPCRRRLRGWQRPGEPDAGGRAVSQPPAVPGAGQEACRIRYCRLRARPAAVSCSSRHRKRKQLGCPDLEEFIGGCDQPAGAREQADLTALPGRLRLEVQHALQRRRDDNMIKTRPATARSMIRWLSASGAASLPGRGEQDWRAACPPGASRNKHLAALVAYAHRKVSDLAEGGGRSNGYPRGTWRMRRLGADSRRATLQFAGTGQQRLRDLAKRWARWRLSTGLEAQACYRGVRALTRFPGFPAAAGTDGAGGITRDVLERYLADLAVPMAGKEEHRDRIGQVPAFPRGIRRRQRDAPLPVSAVIFPEDCPREGEPLPRALAGHVMAQAEDPADLARQDNPAYRLITLILVRCGLRIAGATAIPAGCVVRDADGAPCLRYHNRKMKREALVPIDDELGTLVTRQRERNRERRPDATPVLFPRPTASIDGTRPAGSSTCRDGLYRRLGQCGIRDEHGEPARLTPRQRRHTPGTVLINRDVPQHVVQKILGHDSAEMTARYARLPDRTVRDHWERARKVSSEGRPAEIRAGGALGDAARARQRLSRATRALPNGYRELPLVRTCPHANSCLTCPVFVTSAEFPPQHRAQRQQNGHARAAEMNRQVAGNLDKVIASPEDGGEQKAAAGAP